MINVLKINCGLLPISKVKPEKIKQRFVSDHQRAAGVPYEIKKSDTNHYHCLIFYHNFYFPLIINVPSCPSVMM